MVPVSGSAPSARAGSAPLQLSPPRAGPRASAKGSALAPAPGASALRSPVTGSPSPSVPCLRSRTAGLLPCRELHWDSPALRSQFGGHTQKPPLGRPAWCQSSTPQRPHADWLCPKTDAWAASCPLVCRLRSPLLPLRAGVDRRGGFSEGLLDEGEWEQVPA